MGLARATGTKPCYSGGGAAPAFSQAIKLTIRMSGLRSPERETLLEIHHRRRQAGERVDAELALTLALQVPEYRAEALICKGVDALHENRPQQAFLDFALAAQALPQRADLPALLAHAARLQQQPQLATALLQAAWEKAPSNRDLRQHLWQAYGHSESPERLRDRVEARLPEVTDPAEMRTLLDLLADSKPIGVVRFHPDAGEIRGWLIDPAAGDQPPRIVIQANGRSLDVTLDSPHPLLSQAGRPHGQGAIRIKVPSADCNVQITDVCGRPLLGSPLAVCAPLIEPTPSQGDPASQPVDVIIPVYKGLAETLECVESVLRARKLNKIRQRVIVLDDASPDAELAQRLQALAARGKIHYLRRPANLGFIRNMNRGMTLHPQSDLVWLNADTRVHGDWLDRLRNAAYSAPDIASATPLTNNGELMSFPVSRISHAMPNVSEQAQLDGLARTLGLAPIDIETGCGFCLFIKRRALDQVGYLDEQELLRGYGEETDWCMRARALGWRHVGAVDLFVAHRGGVSFGAEKPLRVLHNNGILRQRYPDAEGRYEAFCLRDPLRPAREALQRARLPALAKSLKTAAQTPHLLITSQVETKAPLSLHHRKHGQLIHVTLQARVDALPLSLEYSLPNDEPKLADDLATLGIGHLHYHLQAHCPRALLRLPSLLKVPYSADCLDDRLLEGDSNELLDFAAHAQSLRLQGSALLARYQTALPQACFVAQPLPQTTTQPITQPFYSALVADALDKPEVAARWLAVARHLRRQQSPVTLLLIEDTPWHADLSSTGICHLLPDIAGLSPTQRLALGGCSLAISLDPNPGAGWAAAARAVAHALPLYAPPSDLAAEAGAHPLAMLPLAGFEHFSEGQL